MKLLLLFPMAMEISSPFKNLIGQKWPEVENKTWVSTTRLEDDHQLHIAVIGIGKVAASLNAMIVLQMIDPAHTVLVGSAGGVGENVKPGDVVIGTQYLQHDYGMRYEGGFEFYRPGTIPLGDKLGGSELLVPTRAPLPYSYNGEGFNVHTGIIASGDSFMSSDSDIARLREHQVLAVDMESAAIAQLMLETPNNLIESTSTLTVVRGISDMADSRAGLHFAVGLEKAAANACEIARQIMLLQLDRSIKEAIL